MSSNLMTVSAAAFMLGCGQDQPAGDSREYLRDSIGGESEMIHTSKDLTMMLYLASVLLAAELRYSTGRAREVTADHRPRRDSLRNTISR
jgi:hypothetical protein